MGYLKEDLHIKVSELHYMQCYKSFCIMQDQRGQKQTLSSEGQFIVCHLVINTPLLTDTLIHVTEEQSCKHFIYMIWYIQLEVREDFSQLYTFVFTEAVGGILSPSLFHAFKGIR